MTTSARITKVAGVMCLVAVCFVAYGLSPVEGQRPEPSAKWEYRAVDFHPDRRDDHTEQLNRLAAEGWEYAGLLIPPYDTNQRLAAKSVVVFRRMK